jgi:ribokinase
VIVSGANLGIDPAGLEEEGLWAGAALLALQNEVAEGMNLLAARAARARGLRVCLNAAPARPLPPDLAALVDILVVNALEAEALSGIAARDIQGAERAARSLSRIVPLALVTAGGDGVAVAERGGGAFVRPAEPVRLVSTHGAGDVFTGFLAAALARGLALEAAVASANGAAARHVAGLPS